MTGVRSLLGGYRRLPRVAQADRMSLPNVFIVRLRFKEIVPLQREAYLRLLSGLKCSITRSRNSCLGAG